MENMMSVKDAAERWGVSTRRVTVLCREGRVAGAVLEKGRWQIPADAEKLADQRVKTGTYRKPTPQPEQLPLPVGISDYRRASSQYCYVDKTLFLRELLDELPAAALFTRPRRFGKSLCMDMVRTFFEKTGEDTWVYFRDTEIGKCGEKYRGYQGKYPVIFLTLKDVKLPTWGDTLADLRFLLASEFQRHGELADSPRCSPVHREYYQRMVTGQADETEMGNALLVLSQMLHAHHGVAPLLLVDEYDTPIQQGRTRGFYEEIVGFLRNLFSGGFKDNPHLFLGLLTGVLREEGLFSGMNNLVTYSVLDDSYGQYFGFTPEEVQQLCAQLGGPCSYEELCQWYGGYRFGDRDIFDPWSVVNCFHKKSLQVYNISHQVLEEALEGASPEFYGNLRTLLQGGSVAVGVDPASVYGRLLFSGYLRPESFLGGETYRVTLPNREIAQVYRKVTLKKLGEMFPPSAAVPVQEAIYTGKALPKRLKKLLRQAVRRYEGEGSYQKLLLGLTALLDGRYFVRSYGESGGGKCEFALKPREETMPGFLVGLRASKKARELKDLAKSALKRLEEQNYDAEGQAVKYGIAFCGNKVEAAKG